MAHCRHLWRPSKKGERCETCGTHFPCLMTCQHFDCMLEKGLPLPDWVSEVTR